MGEASIYLQHWTAQRQSWEQRIGPQQVLSWRHLPYHYLQMHHQTHQAPLLTAQRQVQVMLLFVPCQTAQRQVLVLLLLVPCQTAQKPVQRPLLSVQIRVAMLLVLSLAFQRRVWTLLLLTQRMQLNLTGQKQAQMMGLIAPQTGAQMLGTSVQRKVQLQWRAVRHQRQSLTCLQLCWTLLLLCPAVKGTDRRRRTVW